jgi:hypothetical protein
MLTKAVITSTMCIACSCVDEQTPEHSIHRSTKIRWSLAFNVNSLAAPKSS